MKNFMFINTKGNIRFLIHLHQGMCNHNGLKKCIQSLLIMHA